MPAAPPLAALSDATVRFAERPLFAGIDLSLAAGDRVCLVGRNGSGKSTCLKALAGQIELDGGLRFVQPGARVAYLPQDPDLGDAATIADYVSMGLPEERRHERYRVDEILAALSLDGWRAPTGLSGGEARRVSLARALVDDPDILLLDEPTNHLDLPTIEWMEGRLGGHAGALLMISHDRRFLSALARRVLWLDRGSLRVLEAGFSDFEDWSEQVFAEEEKAAQRLDRRIAAETQWLREGLTARRRRNQGRVRALAQMRDDRRQALGKMGVARLDLSEAKRGGDLAIEATEISKAFGERTVVRGFSTRIRRGDRIGVVGPNGAGKTTLVRMLIGTLEPDAGAVRAGTGLEVGYLDQSRDDVSGTLSLRQVLLPEGGDMISVGGRPRHVAGYLKDFLFDPGRLEASVASLSGGERNRLMLARLFARPSNLLVLDEPTNDLDMETLVMLEDVLGSYAGTVIVVSHDREFLDRIVGSIIAVDGDGGVREYVGGYDDYVRQRPPPRSAKPKVSVGTSRSQPVRTSRKLSYGDQRELEALPGEIDRLTAEIAALEAALADTTLFARDPGEFDRASRRHTDAQAALARAEDRWLELAQRAEDLAG